MAVSLNNNCTQTCGLFIKKLKKTKNKNTQIGNIWKISLNHCNGFIIVVQTDITQQLAKESKINFQQILVITQN